MLTRRETILGRKGMVEMTEFYELDDSWKWKINVKFDGVTKNVGNLK